MSSTTPNDAKTVSKNHESIPLIHQPSQPQPPPPSQPSAISSSPYTHHLISRRSSLLHTKTRETKQLETIARNISTHSTFFLFLWNIYSAIAVFVTMLVTIESLLGCVLTVGATLVAYYSVPLEDVDWNGQLPSVLLSFAVITPLSSSISMAFRRREEALRALASYRSAVYNLYVAHSTWDWAECWKGKGRRGCVENWEDEMDAYAAVTDDVGGAAGSKNVDDNNHENNSPEPIKNKPIHWLHHSDTALRHLIHLSDDLYRYLTLPTATRARHRITPLGRKEANTVLSAGREVFTLNVSGRMIMISQLCEALKHRGLPGNEASRMRPWENFITNAMEDLRVVKEYRTPQALRSFGRLFTLVLPPLYAPSYVQVARDTDSLALGIVLGIVTSLALTGLFECLKHLEDPFVSHVTLDGIDVREELVVLMYQELIVGRGMLFPEAGEFVMKGDDLNAGLDVGKRGGKKKEDDELRRSSTSSYLDRTSRHLSNAKL